MFLTARIVWRYQRGNYNLYIEEEQTKQWPKEKVQKDKQRSTQHTSKTKDRVTRTPLKNRRWTQVLRKELANYLTYIISSSERQERVSLLLVNRKRYWRKLNLTCVILLIFRLITSYEVSPLIYKNGRDGALLVLGHMKY
jgi:hypothetical protein